MGLITYKPTTPSFRKTVKIDKSVLFKGRPEKNLIEELQPSSGRNNTGKLPLDIDLAVIKRNIELLISKEILSIKLVQLRE